MRSGPTRRRARVERFLSAAVALGLAWLPLSAQEGADQAARGFEGPQAVQRAFFEAMQARDATRAARTFPPGMYETEGDARADARRLYEDVFLRTRRFSVSEELPESLPGDEYVFVTWPEDDPDREVEVFYRRGADGGWRFGPRTLRRLDAYAELLADVGPSAAVLADLPALERLHHQLRSSLPSVLTDRAFVLENWQWLGLLVLVLVGVVVDRVVRFLAQRVARRLSARDHVVLDRETLLSFERPTGLFAGALTFELLLPALGMDAGVTGVLSLAVSVVVAVAGVWACYRLVDVVCDYLQVRASHTSSRFDDMLVPLVERTLKVFVVVVGIVFVASRISGDLWGVVAGLSLGSVAIGFAAKDSIENLFGTFTVLLDKPFQVGDWIVAGDLEGTVEEVGFRSTRIRTFYNSVITVPNRQFIASAIDNMGERRYRRIKTTLALTYDTPPEKIEAFCEGVRELIRSHPYTRKDYYFVYLNGFGAASLDVLLYAFVETPDWATELREKHRLFADVLRVAERLEVEFAFPTQTIHVARPEDLEHPDRPASDEAGAAHGRAVAHEVARSTLAPFGGIGQVPPPAAIQREPTAVGGDETEA